MKYTSLFIYLWLQTITIYYPLLGQMEGIWIDDVCKNDRLSKIKGIKSSDYGGRSKFQITLRNMGVEKAYDISFLKAKRRWERVILSDLPDIPAQRGIDWFSGVFGPGKAVNHSIDDVLIGYSVTEIDGIPSNGSNILGQAMPLYVRINSKPSALTVSGMMIFDKADFDSMSITDVELIIAHEMGHILGIGRHTFNLFCGTLCRNLGHSTYQCQRAQLEYKQYARMTRLPHQRLQLSLPDCGHWNESSFTSKSSSELMTPVFEKEKYQPLSRVTVAALEDLGYTVNYDGADPWNKGSNSIKTRTTSNAGVRNNRSELIYAESYARAPQNEEHLTQPRSTFAATESFTLRHKFLPHGDSLMKKFVQFSNSWIVLERV